MKIRIKTSDQGIPIEVPDELGEGLCDAGIAEKVVNEEKIESAAITPPENAMKKPAAARKPGKPDKKNKRSR